MINSLQSSNKQLSTQLATMIASNEDLANRYEVKTSELSLQVSALQSQIKSVKEEKSILVDELDRKKKALNIFHKTLSMKMESRRKQEEEEEKIRLEEEKAEREAIAREEEERKKSFFSFLSNKPARTMTSKPKSTPKPVGRANTNPRPIIPAVIDPNDLINPELEEEMEEQTSIALAQRLAKTEETLYMLQQEVCLLV